MGRATDNAPLFVRAGEGLLAETYKLEESGDELKAVDNPTHRFVVVRSTPETKDVQIRRV